MVCEGQPNRRSTAPHRTKAATVSEDTIKVSVVSSIPSNNASRGSHAINKRRVRMPKWERVGYCPVDSGMILLIDPCYLRDYKPDGWNKDALKACAAGGREWVSESR